MDSLIIMIDDAFPMEHGIIETISRRGWTYAA